MAPLDLPAHQYGKGQKVGHHREAQDVRAGLEEVGTTLHQERIKRCCQLIVPEVHPITCIFQSPRKIERPQGQMTVSLDSVEEPQVEHVEIENRDIQTGLLRLRNAEGSVIAVPAIVDYEQVMTPWADTSGHLVAVVGRRDLFTVQEPGH